MVCQDPGGALAPKGGLPLPQAADDRQPLRLRWGWRPPQSQAAAVPVRPCAVRPPRPGVRQGAPHPPAKSGKRGFSQGPAALRPAAAAGRSPWALQGAHHNHSSAHGERGVEPRVGESYTATASIFQRGRGDWVTRLEGIRGSASSWLCAILSPHQRRRGPGRVDPFSAWSCWTRRTPSRAARGRSRSRPTAASSYRCG